VRAPLAPQTPLSGDLIHLVGHLGIEPSWHKYDEFTARPRSILV
jgi:hypothetical protein